ncbi:sodium/iodide cotransporter-like [Rhipicephalus sanguineus]|uniref:sodium/iodide cotransporter-like n=1 Tax=Rhipicephalus sanguineus TaxID=34632 RepID=UPI0020C22664|nr:sodium/iodide cotransporter-like [Rhipicephalus sanguineus]
MQQMKDLDIYDCVAFGVLTVAGYLVGLYFSFARNRRQKAFRGANGTNAEIEAFLGGQTLPATALAISVVASVANGVNVVSFVGHFYAHGFHSSWVVAGTLVASILTVTAVVPLLYELRVASIFQQTLGAVGIYSAALGISTMFPVPLLYSNIIIGLAGTVYTALGGLRGVVWADCVQALVMFLSPLTIIAKVLYDSGHVTPPLRPITDMNITEYMFRMNMDITSDDTFWGCLIGGLPYIMVRLGFDQMVVQRYMAARNLRAAKIIAVAGAAFVAFFFLLVSIGAVYIIYWYRDCDPFVRGDISNYDQLFLSLYASASGPFVGLIF